MRKGGVPPPSPGAKRKRTNSAGGAPKSTSVSLERWRGTMNAPGQLGLGDAKDWELPDIGSASINAVATWDEAAGAVSAAASSSYSSKEEDQMKQQHLQHHHQKNPKKKATSVIAPVPPSKRMTPPPPMQQKYAKSTVGGTSSSRHNNMPRQQTMMGMSSSNGATVVSQSTHGSGSSKSSGSGSTISSHPSIYSTTSAASTSGQTMMGLSSSGATVVSQSTHGSGSSKSSGSGSTISSHPSIYSGRSDAGPSPVAFDTSHKAKPPKPATPPAVPATASAGAQPPPPTAAVILPTPPAVVPKATLYQFYGKKPRRKQLSNEDYFAWNNGGKPHELKFTALFQCPLTGECFASGRYGDSKFYEVTTVPNNQGQLVEMVWYTKKALAEHGAAAKCYDCLLYREALLEGDHAVKALRPMSSDLPYTKEHAPPLPLVPNLIAEKIRTNRQRIQQELIAPYS